MEDLIFGTFPEFNLQNFKLRALQESDTAAYYGYMTNPNVAASLTEDNVPVNFSAALSDVAYWKNLFVYRRSVFWGIALQSNDMLIGSIGFNYWNRSHKRGELSYDLDYNFWGKGIMYDAMQHVLWYGYNILKMNRIQATIMCNNSRSVKLLERANFQSEGVLREYEIVRGEFVDYYMYAQTVSSLNNLGAPNQVV